MLVGPAFSLLIRPGRLTVSSMKLGRPRRGQGPTGDALPTSADLRIDLIGAQNASIAWHPVISATGKRA